MRVVEPDDRESPTTSLLRSGMRGIGAVALAVVLLAIVGAVISVVVALAY